jgi:hypothetical protein
VFAVFELEDNDRGVILPYFASRRNARGAAKRSRFFNRCATFRRCLERSHPTCRSSRGDSTRILRRAYHAGTHVHRATVYAGGASLSLTAWSLVARVRSAALSPTAPFSSRSTHQRNPSAVISRGSSSSRGVARRHERTSPDRGLVATAGSPSVTRGQRPRPTRRRQRALSEPASRGTPMLGSPRNGFTEAGTRALNCATPQKMRAQVIESGGADGTRTRDPRRDRPVPVLANMSEEERAPHESRIYLFSLAFAHARFWRDIRRTLEKRGMPIWAARRSGVDTRYLGQCTAMQDNY